MGASLPAIGREAFAVGLGSLSPEPLGTDCVEALWRHYEELRRWNPRLSLVGPGTTHEVLERHYGESLAALPWLPAGAGPLVDVGSGAGFPGVVLAAARPHLSVYLVEARQRKWAFLQAACRRAALPCHCLDVRVGVPLPPGLPERFGAVASRAVKLPGPTWEALLERLVPGGRLLLWRGEEEPELPPRCRVVAEAPLPGARVRRLLVAEGA